MPLKKHQPCKTPTTTLRRPSDCCATPRCPSQTVEQEDDDAFVARGNGFCDRKYSDDFIQMRIAQLTARVAELEGGQKVREGQ